MDRLHSKLVSIGICAPPKDTAFHKKVLFIFVSIAICVLFLVMIASALLCAYKYFPIDLPLALSGVYITSAVYAALASMLITFYYRENLTEVFTKLEDVSRRGKQFYECVIIFSIFNRQFFLLEFRANVSPGLATQGKKRCKLLTKLFTYYMPWYCTMLSTFLTCISILALAIYQHGSDFQEFLYVPHGF